MKLYISGGIANVPDYASVFEKVDGFLKIHGYEVVNPVNVQPLCSDDPDSQDSCSASGSFIHAEDKHTWECYMRANLADMLLCDGVAVIDQTCWDSRGSMLEMYVATQTGMKILPWREWCKEATVRQMHGFVQDMLIHSEGALG